MGAVLRFYANDKKPKKEHKTQLLNRETGDGRGKGALQPHDMPCHAMCVVRLPPGLSIVVSPNSPSIFDPRREDGPTKAASAPKSESVQSAVTCYFLSAADVLKCPTCSTSQKPHHQTFEDGAI